MCSKRINLEALFSGDNPFETEANNQPIGRHAVSLLTESAQVRCLESDLRGLG